MYKYSARLQYMMTCFDAFNKRLGPETPWARSPGPVRLTRRVTVLTESESLTAAAVLSLMTNLEGVLNHGFEFTERYGIMQYRDIHEAPSDS